MRRFLPSGSSRMSTSPKSNWANSPGDALETDHQLHGQLAPLVSKQPVEGAFAQLDALGTQQPQILHRRGLVVLLHQLTQSDPNASGNAGPAGPAWGRLDLVQRLDRRLLGDPLDRALRDAELLGDLVAGMPCLEQGLNGMTVKHSEHPPSASVRVGIWMSAGRLQR